jgi:kinesin family protein 6/9
MTTMIANCAIDRLNIDETISTCRFAQRVALIKNDAILNEELDPKLMIDKLKREVQQLKDELSMATGEQRTDALTDDEMTRCEEIVRAYLDDDDPDATIPVGSDLRRVNYCFALLKRHIQEQKSVCEAEMRREEVTSQDIGTIYDTRELQQLKELILQRDNEINILVSMLKKEKAKTNSTTTSQNSLRSSASPVSASSITPEPLGPVSDRKWMVGQQQQSLDEREQRTRNKILGTMSLGRQEAYDIFCRDYEHTASIKSNKLHLKQLTVEAKQLGQQLAQSRSTINNLKGLMKQQQASLAASGFVDLEKRELTAEEIETKQRMEEENIRFKSTVKRLQELKIEIEHLQHLLELARVKQIKDFENWWTQQTATNLSSAGLQDESVRRGQQDDVSRRSPPTSTSQRRLSASTTGESAASSVTTQLHSLNSAGLWSLPRQQPGNSTVSLPRKPGHSAPPAGHSARSATVTDGRYSAANNIPLTGDSQADADIMAFIQARQKIILQAESTQSRHH